LYNAASSLSAATKMQTTFFPGLLLLLLPTATGSA
jgi:hypothetical protein